MLKPINYSTITYKSKGNVDNNSEYQDPLQKWPIRGAAFTNEVGEALRPLIGNYATLSWVPALLYIGADVYDKYKNDQTEYSPDSKRGLKQAIFQGMASVFLPLIAVKAGQNIFSNFGKFTDDKITLNSKEKISKAAEDFIANGKMRAFDGKDNECVKEFLDIVNNNFDFQKQTSNKPIIKTFQKGIEKIAKVFHLNKKEQIDKYAETTIKDLIELRKNLLKPSESMKNSDWYKSYLDAKKLGQTESVAVKSVLTKFQKNKMMKPKFVKTIGGFLALGLAINPIDKFVEHVLIEKVVSPTIDNVKTKDIKNK